MALDKPEVLRSVTAVMLAFSWVFVILRVYVRTWMVKAFGVDDWLAVASLFTFTLHCSFVFVGLSYLSGSTNSTIALLDEIQALKWWYAASLPYIAGTALIKATVGVFLLRFCGSNIHKYIIYAVLAVVTLYDVAYFIICIFQCLPVGHFWLQYTGQKGSCMSRSVLTQLSYTASALNATGDIILGTLPIFLVKKLQMGYRTKVSVACILALGSISCISTVVRLPYLVTLLTTTNFLIATTPVGIWGVVELGLGLIAASMVTLKPLFNAWFKGERSYFGPSKGSKVNTYPSQIRNRSDFIELGEQKPGRARAPTESEEALALDDFPLSNRQTQYGKMVKVAGGGMVVATSATR